jgi:hypothetical protein
MALQETVGISPEEDMEVPLTQFAAPWLKRVQEASDDASVDAVFAEMEPVSGIIKSLLHNLQKGTPAR